MRRPTKPRYPIVSGSGIAFSKRKTYSRETGSRSRYISRPQKSLYIYTVYPIRKIDPPISPGILYPANGSNHFSIQSELKIPELRFPGKEKVNYPELGKTCGYRSSLTARRTDGRTEIIHLRSFLWSRRTRLVPPPPLLFRFHDRSSPRPLFPPPPFRRTRTRTLIFALEIFQVRPEVNWMLIAVASSPYIRGILSPSPPGPDTPYPPRYTSLFA